MGMLKGIVQILIGIHKQRKRETAYLKMGRSELAALIDDELYEAISTRILAEERHMEVEECLEKFKGAKRIFYIANYFDMEVGNGGLCQYFVNSSRLTAPWILDALHAVGAENQRTLLADFIGKNKIDLTDLNSFMITDAEEFEAQNARYPFDDFDDAYYNIDEKYPLCSLLDQYARKHLDEFDIFTNVM